MSQLAGRAFPAACARKHPGDLLDGNRAEIMKLADALEACVAASTGGWANERALSRFNKLARALAEKLEEGEGRRRIGDLVAWAKLLYGTRRHRRWACGVEQLRQAMLAELTRLRASAAPKGAAPLFAGDPAADR